MVGQKEEMGKSVLVKASLTEFGQTRFLVINLFGILLFPWLLFTPTTTATASFFRLPCGFL